MNLETILQPQNNLMVCTDPLYATEHLVNQPEWVCPTVEEHDGNIHGQRIPRPVSAENELYTDQSKKLKQYLEDRKHREAVLYGMRLKQKLQDDPFRPKWVFLEVRLNLAKALIYIGEADMGIGLIDEILQEMEYEEEPEQSARLNVNTIERRYRLLGYSHNLLGYAYWMEKGCLRKAGEEFNSARRYFRLIHAPEDEANACDNLARVYALQMSRGQAQSLVERGLKLRRSIGHENRIALSLNSSAIVSLTFGEPYRAWQLSDEVKRIFENLQEKRGFGLACITLGRALRQLSKCEDEYKDIDCVQFLEEAIDNLKQAVLLFEQQVEEPIRRVEALSELGYTYADLANTLSVNLINTPAVDYKKLAIETLEKASELAAGKYYVWYVQNCVGLAHLYSLNQDYEKAELWLGRANEVLSLSDVQVSNRDHTGTTIGSIDGLYYQGGQIQLLLGHWALERDRSVCKLETLQENLVQALTHYIAATIHFSRFSKDCLNSNSDIFAEIFSHLHRFTIDDIRDAWKQVETTQNVSCSDEASRLTDFWENVLLVMVAK